MNYSQPYHDSAVLWDDNHPVLLVLRERLKRNSTPESRADNYSIALAIEGGGARGIVSAGMLMALADLGLTDCFDAIYASSSGALNAAALLAGDSASILDFYLRSLTDRNFINRRRLLVGKPIMDLNYLFNEIISQQLKMDLDRILQSQIKFAIEMTLVDSMQSIIVSDFHSSADLIAALKATSWRPIEAGGATVFRGERVIDGSTLRPLSYRSALEDGCTHVLSLSTKPTGQVAASPSRLQFISALRMELLHRGLGRSYLSQISQKANDHKWLVQQRFISSESPHPQVLDFSPPTTGKAIHNTETGVSIIDAARSSYSMMHSAIAGHLESNREASWPRTTIKISARRDR